LSNYLDLSAKRPFTAKVKYSTKIYKQDKVLLQSQIVTNTMFAVFKYSKNSKVV